MKCFILETGILCGRFCFKNNIFLILSHFNRLLIDGMPYWIIFLHSGRLFTGQTWLQRISLFSMCNSTVAEWKLYVTQILLLFQFINSLLYALSFSMLQNSVLFPYLVLHIIVSSAFPVPYCKLLAVRDFDAFEIRVCRVEC